MEIQLRTASWRDYLALSKPRVVLLHLVTAAVSMVIAAGGLPSLGVLAATLAGGGLVAAASNALNCYFDRDIDQLMRRTCHRPVASGRINPEQALMFTAVLTISGEFLLVRFVSPICAILAAAALLYYVFVYTLWLKRQTYWGSIIASAAGAFPPVIGWLAVTGRFEITPLLLASIIAFWTLPHFWALAIWRQKEYSAAGLKVIPTSQIHIWINGFSFLLILVSLLVAFTSSPGIIYLAAAILLGLGIVILNIYLNLKTSSQTARALFLYSNFYLAALFAAMLADKLL